MKPANDLVIRLAQEAGISISPRRITREDGERDWDLDVDDEIKLLVKLIIDDVCKELGDVFDADHERDYLRDRYGTWE